LGIIAYTQICVQANLWCTSSRARKVVISLTLGALTVEVINMPCFFLAHICIVNDILAVVFWLIIPTAVLVINVVVAIQVRRSAINAAANFGVQPHHQSTSAVPTIMLITTSLIYVLLNTMRGGLFILMELMPINNISSKTYDFVERCYSGATAVYQIIFAYNFYVYLITGKLFRSDLHKLLCRCSASSSSAPALAHAHVAPPPAVIAAADDDDCDDEVARRDVTAHTAV